jgi:3-oxoacyl-[acyl-carrier-protein] synthase-3
MVVERTSPTDNHRIYSSHLGSDGTLWDYFHIVAGGSNLPATPDLLDQKLDKMQMKGREMFKVAVKGLSDYASVALQANGLTKDQLDWLVPHQANLRIIEAVAKRLEFPMEKVIVNIDRYGNTSSATVPTAFDEAVRDGRIRSGSTVLLDVFGAGLTYGSMLLRF